jgi:hypothetical protein
MAASCSRSISTSPWLLGRGRCVCCLKPIEGVKRGSRFRRREPGLSDWG